MLFFPEIYGDFQIINSARLLCKKKENLAPINSWKEHISHCVKAFGHMKPETTTKLTVDLHRSLSRKHRVCTPLCVPGGPTRIHSFVLHGQVGQAEL